MVPALVVENEVVARNPDSPHGDATKQQPKSFNTKKMMGNFFGKHENTPIKDQPSQGRVGRG